MKEALHERERQGVPQAFRERVANKRCGCGVRAQRVRLVAGSPRKTLQHACVWRGVGGREGGWGQRAARLKPNPQIPIPQPPSPCMVVFLTSSRLAGTCARGSRVQGPVSSVQGARGPRVPFAAIGCTMGHVYRPRVQFRVQAPTGPSARGSKLQATGRPACRASWRPCELVAQPARKQDRTKCGRPIHNTQLPAGSPGSREQVVGCTIDGTIGGAVAVTPGPPHLTIHTLLHKHIHIHTYTQFFIYMYIHKFIDLRKSTCFLPSGCPPTRSR